MVSEHFKNRPLAGGRSSIIAAALAAVLFAALTVGAQEAPAISLNDAAAVIRILRDPNAGPTPGLLTRRETRIIASVYHQGQCVALVSAQEQSPGDAAKSAANMLNEALRAGDALEARQTGIISIDILKSGRDVELVANEAVGSRIRLGLEGIEISSGGRVFFAPPLMVMRHSTAPNFLESLFKELRAEAPAFQEGRLKAKAFTTDAFAEKSHGGEVAELSMGTFPITAFNRQDVLRSLLSGAYWLMVSQDEEGHFMQRYDPLAGRIIPVSDIGTDLKAADTLLKLFMAIGDRDLRAAADKTINFAIKNLRDMGGPVPSSYVRHGTEDELPASVALLQALATRASVTGQVDSMDRLVNLGNFIIEMTGRRGGMHLSLRAKVAGEEALTATGGVAEEAAMALCSLYELARAGDRTQWLEAARRIIDGQVAALAPEEAPHPKLILALARFYAVSNEDRYAESCLTLGKRLAGGFHAADGDTPKVYVGGFRRETGPMTLQTALALQAVSTSFDVSRIPGMGRMGEIDPNIIIEAARFVMNQQLGDANSFYVARPDVVSGSFRAGVRDSLVTSVVTREAIEALVSATTIVPME